MSSDINLLDEFVIVDDYDVDNEEIQLNNSTLNDSGTILETIENCKNTVVNTYETVTTISSKLISYASSHTVSEMVDDAKITTLLIIHLMSGGKMN